MQGDKACLCAGDAAWYAGLRVGVFLVRLHAYDSMWSFLTPLKQDTMSAREQVFPPLNLDALHSLHS